MSKKQRQGECTVTITTVSVVVVQNIAKIEISHFFQIGQIKPKTVLSCKYIRFLSDFEQIWMILEEWIFYQNLLCTYIR